MLLRQRIQPYTSRNTAHNGREKLSFCHSICHHYKPSHESSKQTIEDQARGFMHRKVFSTLEVQRRHSAFPDAANTLERERDRTQQQMESASSGRSSLLRTSTVPKAKHRRRKVETTRLTVRTEQRQDLRVQAKVKKAKDSRGKHDRRNPSLARNATGIQQLDCLERPPTTLRLGASARKPGEVGNQQTERARARDVQRRFPGSGRRRGLPLLTAGAKKVPGKIRRPANELILSPSAVSRCA